MTTRSARLDVPGWLFVPAVAGSLFIVLPLAAMLTRVDWADLPQLITSPGARTALLLSL